MIPSTRSANSSTPPRAAVDAAQALAAAYEEDLALGCECANPALQIEAWGTEAAPQPLREFN